ncbi:hypothetical protein ACJX0J_042076 [Zea mays]
MDVLCYLIKNAARLLGLRQIWQRAALILVQAQLTKSEEAFFSAAVSSGTCGSQSPKLNGQYFVNRYNIFSLIAIMLSLFGGYSSEEFIGLQELNLLNHHEHYQLVQYYIQTPLFLGVLQVNYIMQMHFIKKGKILFLFGQNFRYGDPFQVRAFLK